MSPFTGRDARKQRGPRASDSRKTGVLQISLREKPPCFQGLQGVNGYPPPTAGREVCDDQPGAMRSATFPCRVPPGRGDEPLAVRVSVGLP